METLIEVLHSNLLQVCQLLATLIEIWGTILLVIVVVKEIINVIKGGFNFEEMHADMQLNQGLSTVLEVYLVAEVLKSVYMVGLQNLLGVGLLVLLRVFIAFALHWEGKNKHEEHDH